MLSTLPTGSPWPKQGRKFAPGIYRLTKWAFNFASDLVIGDAVPKPAPGVEQSDRFEPPRFTIGIQPILKQVATTLGNARLILAYLGNIYIFSLDNQVLP